MFFEYGKQYWYLCYNWPTRQRGLSEIAELLNCGDIPIDYTDKECIKQRCVPLPTRQYSKTTIRLLLCSTARPCQQQLSSGRQNEASRSFSTTTSLFHVVNYVRYRANRAGLAIDSERRSNVLSQANNEMYLGHSLFTTLSRRMFCKQYAVVEYTTSVQTTAQIPAVCSTAVHSRQIDNMSCYTSVQSHECASWHVGLHGRCYVDVISRPAKWRRRCG